MRAIADEGRVPPKPLPLPSFAGNEGGLCTGGKKPTITPASPTVVEGRARGLMRVHNSCGNAVRCTTGSTRDHPRSYRPAPICRSWLLRPTWYTIHTRRVASHRDVPRLTVYSRARARDRLLIISRGASGCGERRHAPPGPSILEKWPYAKSFI